MASFFSLLLFRLFLFVGNEVRLPMQCPHECAFKEIITSSIASVQKVFVFHFLFPLSSSCFIFSVKSNVISITNQAITFRFDSLSLECCVLTMCTAYALLMNLINIVIKIGSENVDNIKTRSIASKQTSL